MYYRTPAVFDIFMVETQVMGFVENRRHFAGSIEVIWYAEFDISIIQVEM